MEVNQLVKKGMINALNGFDINPYDNINIIFIKQRYDSKKVKNYIYDKTNCNEDRIKKSLLMVNLLENVLERNINELSSGEKLKIELAISLILNHDELFLFQFDKYFTERELIFFKNLLKKLVLKYHKTIILFDVDINFMLDFVDRLVILGENNIVKVFLKDNLFNEEIFEYVDKSDIIDFINYINKDKKILNNYTSVNELIKAIYREV